MRSSIARSVNFFFRLVKKNGGTKACSDAKLRNDLVEVIASILMYYNDMMLCYGISAEELKQSYLENCGKQPKMKKP